MPRILEAMDRTNLPQQGLILVTGHPGSGRTTLAFDIALRVKAITLHRLIYISQKDLEVPWVDFAYQSIRDIPDVHLSSSMICILDDIEVRHVACPDHWLVILITSLKSGLSKSNVKWTKKFILADGTDHQSDIDEETSVILRGIAGKGRFFSLCIDDSSVTWFRSNPRGWRIHIVT